MFHPKPRHIKTYSEDFITACKLVELERFKELYSKSGPQTAALDVSLQPLARVKRALICWINASQNINGETVYTLFPFAALQRALYYRPVQNFPRQCNKQRSTNYRPEMEISNSGLTTRLISLPSSWHPYEKGTSHPTARVMEVMEQHYTNLRTCCVWFASYTRKLSAMLPYSGALKLGACKTKKGMWIYTHPILNIKAL